MHSRKTDVLDDIVDERLVDIRYAGQAELKTRIHSVLVPINIDKKKHRNTNKSFLKSRLGFCLKIKIKQIIKIARETIAKIVSRGTAH